MSVKHINADGEYGPALDAAGSGLAVVDFFATWCGPCTNIAPKFEELARLHPTAAFLKVDCDKCPDTAAANGVSAMPTFLFFVNKAKVDTLSGADPNALEAKVKRWAGSVSTPDPGAPKGQVELSAFLEKTGLECLNEDDHHNLRDLLIGGRLFSDCDEQLIMNLPFNQPVKIHSIILKGPKDEGPKKVKLFINHPTTPDFSRAEATPGVQELELTEDQVVEGEVLELRFVKFQNVRGLQIFIENNQGGGEKTILTKMKIYGSPLSATNMSEFKRVAGKKGEAGH